MRRFTYGRILAATVLTILVLWLVGTVADVLMLLFVGILLAIYLHALAAALHHRLRVPQRLAFLAALLVSLAAVALLFTILVPPLVAQTQQLVKLLPQYVDQWQQNLDRMLARIPALTGVIAPGQQSIVLAIYDQAAGTLQNVVPKLFAGVHALISIFSVGVMAIYLALAPTTYTDILESLFPPVRRPFVHHILGELGDTLRAYIVAQLFTMTVLGILTAIGLYLLGVPYALTFGVFTGLAAIVPFFGTLLSTTLPALFVLNTPGGGTRALLVLGLGVVIHLIEGNVVGPLVMSEKVNLPRADHHRRARAGPTPRRSRSAHRHADARHRDGPGAPHPRARSLRGRHTRRSPRGQGRRARPGRRFRTTARCSLTPPPLP